MPDYPPATPGEMLAIVSLTVGTMSKPATWDAHADELARKYLDEPAAIPDAWRVLDRGPLAHGEDEDDADDVGWLTQARPGWPAERRHRVRWLCGRAVLELVGHATANLRDQQP